MSDEERNMALVKFLATEADKLTVRQAPDRTGDQPDENFWSRLGDQLVSPRELSDVAKRLDDPHVRRRVAGLISRWKDPAELDVDRGPTEAQKVISRYRTQWAVAASILVAVGVLLTALVYLKRAPSFETLYAQAKTHVSADRHGQGRQIMDRLLADDKLGRERRDRVLQLYGLSHYRQAEQLVAAHRYPEALAEADAAIKRGVGSEGVFLLKAAATLGRPVGVAAMQLARITPRVTDAGPMPPKVRELELVFQQAKSKLPNAPFAYRELAYLYMEHSRYALASENADYWHQLDPKSIECLNLRGLAYYGLEKHNQAVARFEEGLDLAQETGTKVVLHRNIADAYLDDRRQPRLAKAVSHYAQAAELETGRPIQPRTILADLLKAGRLKGTQLAEAQKLHAETYLDRARQLVEEGRPALAMKELDAAVAAGAVSERLFLLKASIAAGQEIQVAQVDLRTIAPRSRDIAVKSLLPEPARSLEGVYEQAGQAMPSDPFAPRELTYLYLKHKHYESAAKAAGAWNRIDPKSDECLNLWGWVLFQQNKYAQAVAKFTQALSLTGDAKRQAILHFNIAETQFDDDKTTQFGEVLAHYERSLALDPSHAGAARARARAREMRTQWKVTPTTLPSY